MDEQFLYQKIAEDIRRKILDGQLKPGDRLPVVRVAAQAWNCTIGTVQRAYAELVRQGLLSSRPGQGTRVVLNLPQANDDLLRRAALLHRTEAFLLEMFTAGYTPPEVQQALHLALDRWQQFSNAVPLRAAEQVLRFVGSHDPAVTEMAFALPLPLGLEVEFAGSLGGLMALANGQAHLAGAHLWDVETDEYNVPFVRRLLPGRRVALMTLAQRRLGLMLRADWRGRVRGLEDLVQPDLRFVNRQPGSGTRVWLDAQLKRLGIAAAEVAGYQQGVGTHLAVARAVAEGRADVGLGLEAAALAQGLQFVFLTLERYDLVVPAEVYDHAVVQALGDWLTGAAARNTLQRLGGYECALMGQVIWLD